MVPEERLPATLVVAMAVLGVLAAIAAVVSGHLAVARGITVGAGLAVVYLAVLWRYVLAFVARAQGRRVAPGDQVILQTGMPGRLFLAGSVLFWVARKQPWINLWAAIGAFLAYRVLLAAYQIQAIMMARKGPAPPAIGWDTPDDTFISRERRSIGRRRWRKGR